MSIFLDFFGWIGKLPSFVMVPLAIFVLALIVLWLSLFLLLLFV